MSLKRKILLLITLGLFISIIASFALSYVFVAKSETSNFIENTQPQLKNLCSYLEIFMQDATRLNSVLAKDEDLIASNGRLSKYLDLQEEITTDSSSFHFYEQNLFKTLLNYKKSFPSYKSVYVATQDGGFLQAPDATIPPAYNPTQSSWYQEALSSRGHLVISKPHFIDDQVAYTLSSAFYKDGYFQGVLGTDLILDQLTKYLDTIQFAQSDHLIIFDPNGYIIYDSANKERLLKKFDQINSPEIQELYWKKSASDYITLDLIDHLVIIQGSPKGWRTMLFIETSELNKSTLRKSLLRFFLG